MASLRKGLSEEGSTILRAVGSEAESSVGLRASALQKGNTGRLRDLGRGHKAEPSRVSDPVIREPQTD